MAEEKLVFWVRNESNGDVAGPFAVQEMSEYLKRLPKEKLGDFQVKSSKWNDWKPLSTVVKDRPGASPPPKPGAKAPSPPATPKVSSKAAAPSKSAGPDLAISSTDGSGAWQTNESGASAAGAQGFTPPSSGEASSEDAFSDALERADSLSFENSLAIEKAKLSNARQHKRYFVDIEVTFLGTSGETFVTKTKDISLGGIQFADPVPLSFFEESALVSLFYKSARQRFSANLLPVGAQKGFATRANFSYLPPKNLETLHDWLKSGESKEAPDYRVQALKKKKT